MKSNNAKAASAKTCTENKKPGEHTGEVLIDNSTSFCELVHILLSKPEVEMAAVIEEEEKAREEKEARQRETFGEDYDAVVGTSDKNLTVEGLEKLRRRPGAVQLRNNELCIARISIGTDGVCEVFSNGYAIYDNGERKTVVWVLDCAHYTYKFGKLHDNEKLYQDEVMAVDADVLGMSPWYHAVMLKGEDQIWANMSYSKSPNTISDFEDVEEWEAAMNNDGALVCRFDDPETAYLKKEKEEERRKSLSDRQRDAYVLQSAGYTQMEIAEIMGISQPAVNKLLKKSFKKFRDQEVND